MIEAISNEVYQERINDNENENEESMIYPTFRDERIDTFIKAEYKLSNYINALSSTITNINNLKEIILLLLNKNLQNKENEFIEYVSEYNIDIKLFLTTLFFLKRRVNLFYELKQNKITLNEFITQSKNPFLLMKLMNDETNMKTDDHNNDNDLFYELYKEEKNIVEKMCSLEANYTPNIKSFCVGINILNLHLNDAYKICKLILNSQNIADIEKDNQLHLCQKLYKIQSVGILICNLYFLGQDSIYNKGETSYEWTNIKTRMSRICDSNKRDINDTLDEINKNLSVAFCSMNRLERHLSNNSILDNSMKGALMAYYYVRKKEAKYEADKFLINPDIKICQKIWGLTENKESKKLIKIVLPHIEYRETFYIARKKDDIIDNEVINKLTNEINKYDFQIQFNDDMILNHNKNNYKIFEDEQQFKNKDTIFENDNAESVLCRSDRIKTKKELKSINKETKKLDYVKIVLTHNSHIKTPLDDENNSFFNGLLCCNINPQFSKNSNNDSIILHIHGGGFITLSPLSHENYTRKIVNHTGIPLISVDYRLSPEYSFPSALDDVYQAYTWLIENGENDLNLKINNIILLGDSAGGNLILSLTYILLIRGMRLPNMILLAYPAVKMNILPLSLSYLNSLYDPLLDYNLLSFCLRSYLGENSDEYNPFLSPLYMNPKIIKYLPKLKIYGGTADPLRDDYVEFFHKCNKAFVDCELVEFKYFPHGFLNYDYSFIMPQASKCTDIISEEIEKNVNNIIP